MPDLTVIPATPATAFGSSKIASLLISCFVRINVAGQDAPAFPLPHPHREYLLMVGADAMTHHR